MKKTLFSICVSLSLTYGMAMLASCKMQAQQTTTEKENQSSMNLTWIEDKPGPSLNDCALFPEVSDSLWRELGLKDGVPASMSCFLLQTEGKNILFDAGLGAPFSKLQAKLKENGLNADSIDAIFITHHHPDHIGGLTKDGKAVFAHATIYLNKLEADAWSQMPNEQNGGAKAMMDIYKDQLQLFNAGDTLMCGILPIAAYGHTPGHTVFQKDSMLIVGDLMHGVALQSVHPEYYARYVMDKEKSVAARKHIMQYAKEKGLTMYGMHFPKP